MKRNEQQKREQELLAAQELVALLVEEHHLPIVVEEVTVGKKWKTKFKFRVEPLAPPMNVSSTTHKPRTRFGRRPGLEVHWETGKGDVDAFQYDGDVVTFFAHSFQIFGRWFTGKEEKPSKTLRVLKKRLEEQKKKGVAHVGSTGVVD